MPHPPELCRRIPGLAAQTGHPLKQIAIELGFSGATVSKWERGERFPNGHNLELLAEYTGQPPCHLLCAHARRCRNHGCLLKRQARG